MEFLKWPKPYNHLVGYLERWTILKVGRLHVRLHKITRNDSTPFMHTHPFAYVSIILKGGYVEQLNNREVTNKVGHVIIRKSTDFHRIKTLLKDTVTLFITWERKDRLWTLKKHDIIVDEWINYPRGIYKRNLNGTVCYSKFDEYWFTGSGTIEEAKQSTKPSIHQSVKPESDFFVKL